MSHVLSPFHMSYFTNTTMSLGTGAKLISRSLHMSCHTPAIEHYITLGSGVKLISRSWCMSYPCHAPDINITFHLALESS